MKKSKRTSKPKPLNSCDNKFVIWIASNHYELPGNYAVTPNLYKDDPMYAVWQAAWRSAYSAGIMRGQKQGRQQVEYFNLKARRPMSYSTMEDLFEGCKNGREYGLKIERWHGIFHTEEDRELDAWYIKQCGHKV